MEIRFLWPGFNERVLELLLVSNEPSVVFDVATKRVGNFCEVKALIFWKFLDYVCLVEVRDAGSARGRSGKCFLDSFWARART